MRRINGLFDAVPRSARCGLTLICLALVGCGARTSEPDVDGQSHWWTLCAVSDDCSEGYQCACGSCTKACSAAESCGSNEQVQCALRLGVCADDYALAEAHVCQARCVTSAQCPAALACHAGVCVAASVVDAPETAPAPTATDTQLDASDGAFQCGEGGDTACPPPPVDWCTSDIDTPLPPPLVAYWSSFCDGGLDASSPPSALCGDGIVQVSEVCDDGNTQGGDGCAGTCNAIEEDYDCTLAGQPCKLGG